MWVLWFGLLGTHLTHSLLARELRMRGHQVAKQTQPTNTHAHTHTHKKKKQTPLNTPKTLITLKTNKTGKNNLKTPQTLNPKP